MTPEAFIAKWQNSPIKERASAQEHFLDLCRMLGELSPAEADRQGIDSAQLRQLADAASLTCSPTARSLRKAIPFVK